MARKRVNPASDDEDIPNTSPVPKRARTTDNTRDVEVEQNSRSQRNKGKGKGREDSSDEEDQETEDHTDNINDEQFEERFHERIEKAVDAKRNVVGGVAEHGIIESIEMHNFMCHKYLSFQFGPQINFIIGHNGSGKSAVLSAITIALGGKSTSTGRGSGLKSFIREGQPASEITITLKNQGDEAYKPHEYGKSIQITRRFTKEGSSTWKIKGTKSKNTISSKREELSAICDHMNIQVDNPMNVLTQDAARQFLSASAPGDKYKFFLRGTQLSQLATEYETCLENITNTTKVLKNKKEAIPDLKQALREASTRYEEAAQAMRQQEKLRELKIELSWAHVKVKEKELQKKMEDLEKAKRQLEKIEASIATTQAEVEAAGDDVRKHEDELKIVGNIDDLIERRSELKVEIRSHKDKINKCTSDLKTINQSIVGLDKSIQEFQTQIAAETERMAKDTQDKREAFARKMQEAQSAIAAIETTIRQNASRRSELAENIKSSREAGEEKQRELEQLKQNISTIESDIGQLKRSENDKYAAYGPGMAQAIPRITQTKWHGDVPLGPLGLHVKVRDPDAWADLLAQQLSGQLTAFAITDARDRDTLKRILESYNLRGNQIIIYEKDLFDYSEGEPDQDVLTVLRALEIENPYVERILINQRGIERLMLARTRRDGESVLRRVGGGNAWTQDLFNIRRFPEGGGSTNPLNRPARSQMLRNEDTATRQRYLENEKARLESLYGPLNQQVQTLRTAFMSAKREDDQVMTNDRKAHTSLQRAKLNVQALNQEADEDTPVNVQGLEEAKLESEQEKEGLMKQFEEISRTKEEHGQANSILVHQDNDLKAQITNFHQREQEVNARVEAAAQVRMKAQHSLKHYRDKEAEATRGIEMAQGILDTTTEEFETWTDAATNIGPRVETNKKPEDIQRQMDNVKHALQEREKKQGYSIDEVVKDVNIAREKLERAQKDYKSMVYLNKILKSSLVTRLSRWQEFRRHIALRCKLVFRYNLSQRGYYGNILFNHSEQTLSLKVQTDDQLATQDGSKEKDPRSLSGGEKSFSTICLLLSLWESIGCPLRCLDEFDVFMDAVNRRISMKMMIDTANQSDKKQYILITPQDMNNIRIGPTVRVHRMTDPERGQGVLAMS